MRVRTAVRRKRSRYTLEHVEFICNVLADEALLSELNLTISCSLIPLISAPMKWKYSHKHMLC